MAYPTFSLKDAYRNCRAFQRLKSSLENVFVQYPLDFSFADCLLESMQPSHVIKLQTTTAMTQQRGLRSLREEEIRDDERDRGKKKRKKK